MDVVNINRVIFLSNISLGEKDVYIVFFIRRIYLLSYGYDVRGVLICFVGDGCDGESRGYLFGPFDAATFRAFGAKCCLEDAFSFSLNGQCRRCLVFGWIQEA